MRWSALVAVLAVAQVQCSLHLVRPPVFAPPYEPGPGSCTTNSTAPALDVAGATVTGTLGGLTLAAAVSCNGINGNGCSETLPLLWLAVPLLVTAGVYGYSAWYGLDAIHRCNAAALGAVPAPPRP